LKSQYHQNKNKSKFRKLQLEEAKQDKENYTQKKNSKISENQTENITKATDGSHSFNCKRKTSITLNPTSLQKQWKPEGREVSVFYMLKDNNCQLKMLGKTALQK
jgi:hypothetical protein